MEQGPHNQSLEHHKLEQQVLHPDQVEQDPTVLSGNFKTGEPLLGFDYEAALKMSQSPGIVNEALEKPIDLEKNKVGVYKPEIVLRPDTLQRREEKRRIWGMTQRAQELVTASIVGVASAMVPVTASAGGVNTRAYEDAVKIEAANAVLRRVGDITGGDAVIRRDPSGRPVLTAMTPQEKAMNLKADYEGGKEAMLSYADSIGMQIINEGTLFAVQNASNPSEEVSVTTYHNPNQYSKQIIVRKAKGGGLQVTIYFTVNGVSKTEVVLIRTISVKLPDGRIVDKLVRHSTGG